MVFGGIIEERGTITEDSTESEMYLEVSDKVFDSVEKGHSVAVNGVCLTVVTKRIPHNILAFNLSKETRAKTHLVPGDVHVEVVLRLGDPIGGHEITGHVFGTCQFAGIDKDNNMTIQWPPASTVSNMPLPGYKDGIAIDGVSLTVASVDPNNRTITIALIPVTLERTLFPAYEMGRPVNIELSDRGFHHKEEEEEEEEEEVSNRRSGGPRVQIVLQETKLENKGTTRIEINIF